MNRELFAVVPYDAHANALTVPQPACCPTCHRPFGTLPENLTPAYFRALQPPTPLPASDDEDEGGGDGEPVGHSPRAPVELSEDEGEALAAQGYYSRNFVEVRKLGHGSFGGVYLCRHVVEGNSLGLFAVKKIPIATDPALLRRALVEVRLLEETKGHMNCLSYLHSWVDYARVAMFGPIVRCLFVLVEFATEGSLEDYLSRHGTRLSTPAVWFYFLSALAGTAHLHERGIIHRDLKPSNLLVTIGNGANARAPGAPPLPRVLVADFGAAASLRNLAGVARTFGSGTAEWSAPETLDEAQTCAHTLASDVYSLGLILHYLACDGSLPVALEDRSVVVNMAHSPVPRPREMVELMRAMLDINPARRPTCAAILAAPFIQQLLQSFASPDFSPDLPPEQLPLLIEWRRQQSAHNLARTRRTSPIPSFGVPELCEMGTQTD